MLFLSYLFIPLSRELFHPKEKEMIGCCSHHQKTSLDTSHDEEDMKDEENDKEEEKESGIYLIKTQNMIILCCGLSGKMCGEVLHTATVAVFFHKQ
jgi:hypothetical protein